MGHRTPLYAEHERLGARLVPFVGWDMPLHYGSQLEEHHKVKKIACAQCPIACEQVSAANQGAYAGAMTGIEYECLYANGPNLGIGDMNAIIKLIDLCDRGGMDAMSSGVTVSWAMESFERHYTAGIADRSRPYPGVVDGLAARARKVTTGPGDGTDVEMGPVITAAARDRIKGLIDKGATEGAQHVGVVVDQVGPARVANAAPGAPLRELDALLVGQPAGKGRGAGERVLGEASGCRHAAGQGRTGRKRGRPSSSHDR